LKNHKFKLFERFFFSSKNPKISKSIKIKKIKKYIYEEKCAKMTKIKQRFKLLSTEKSQIKIIREIKFSSKNPKISKSMEISDFIRRANPNQKKHVFWE
jgi:hypothetical protein